MYLNFINLFLNLEARKDPFPRDTYLNSTLCSLAWGKSTHPP